MNSLAQEAKKTHRSQYTSKRQGASTSNQQSTKRARSNENGCESEEVLNAIITFTSCQEFVSHYTSLEPLPLNPPKLTALTSTELEELESALGFEPGSHYWRDDWNGNLAYAQEEIVNPAARIKKNQSLRQSLFAWAQHNGFSKRLLGNLVRHVCCMENVPSEAKRILACADLSSVQSIESAVRRVGYDPVVLEQDGWMIRKGNEPSGSIGGPFRIGDLIRWQNSDAVVIAFVHDHDLGDLWKACWIEDMYTFDLEAEEIVEARQKWERRNQIAKPKSGHKEQFKQSRANGSYDFRVAGIEEAIVLASSISPGARPGVFWPARVMHASEHATTLKSAKRSITKYKISLVFLSPYWDANSNGRRREALSEQCNTNLDVKELFQIESVEANVETVKEYTFDPIDGIDLSKVEMAFRFTGLPKSAFQCFVNSHRLALGLKQYARQHIKAKITATEIATFGLFDSHPLSLMVPIFPSIALNLPFDFILSELPVINREDAFYQEREEILNISAIIDSMKSPRSCQSVPEATVSNHWASATKAPNSQVKMDSQPASYCAKTKSLGLLLVDYPKLETFFEIFSDRPLVSALGTALVEIYSWSPTAENTKQSDRLSSSEINKTEMNDTPYREVTGKGHGFPMRVWATLKSHGCDVISATGSQAPGEVQAEWMKFVECIYRRLRKLFSECATLVTTDSSCNLHVTSGLNLERSVRLPAALKGAMLATSATQQRIEVTNSVGQEVVKYVESTLLQRVHDYAYLKRMKGLCTSAKSENEILMLTEDSDGVGGEDTRGCRGTWKAAVHAVAVAVAAVDEVVRGTYSNAFCATRPPGHHAGRKLHAMKAVSNGFCILNSVACAAVHAVSPVEEGGIGLRRACVIDFDVHHGNGTQDILCATYDPRFLYISIHAGGVQENGKDSLHSIHSAVNSKRGEGDIFPGKCGETSPHRGVLNIPLGPKVTSHAVGSALLNRVAPAVENFSPDVIFLSAGFDAHKHDPMGLGALSAEDFGHITEAACQLAFKTCSGRVVSVLEGGYGVPCCRAQSGFLPAMPSAGKGNDHDSNVNAETGPRPQPSKLVDLSGFLPESMDDQVPLALQKQLERCHDEGFIECIREHVLTLARCTSQKD